MRIDYLKDFEANLDYYFSEVLNYPFAKPYWIYISLSHRCTYNCKMCGVVKILKGYELPEEVVKKTLDGIAKWRKNCVVLLTGGEPFLRKDIFEIIRYSVGRSLKTEVVSNGSLINGELAHKIISSGIKNIAVSLDGAKESTHDSIREKGSFKKAINAVKTLVKIKKILRGGPQISVWTTIMKENAKELFDIIGMVRDLGVECLVYHPVIAAQEDMQNTSVNAPFWIKKEELIIFKEQIDKIVEYQNKNDLVAFLHDPYLWIKYFEGTLNKEYWKCNPFVFMNIGPDGEVRSCGSAFGNVKERSLDECLTTNEASHARRLMKFCKKPCLQTCWAHPASDSLEEIINLLLSKVKESDMHKESKGKIIQSALDMLIKYEKMLKNA